MDVLLHFLFDKYSSDECILDFVYFITLCSMAKTLEKYQKSSGPDQTIVKKQEDEVNIEEKNVWKCNFELIFYSLLIMKHFVEFRCVVIQLV